jgi:hypothetical protein
MSAPATPLAGTRQPSRTTGGGSSGGGSACDECTFRPQITPKAAAKKARSVTEMSEGDRLRREVRLVSGSGPNEHNVLHQCFSRIGIKAYTQALVCLLVDILLSDPLHPISLLLRVQAEQDPTQNEPLIRRIV